MNALPKMPLVARMTVAEFMEWSAATPGRWQLMDGEPVAMAPASDTHGSIQAEMVALFRNHLRARGLPCRVVVAPGMVPRLRASKNVRVPDLAVTCQAPSLQRRLMEQPVMAVEILSPSNEDDTWRNVWSYASIPSVRDILVVRSLEIGAEVTSRREDGSWPEDFTTVSGRMRLASIDAEFDVAEFYATTELARPVAP